MATIFQMKKSALFILLSICLSACQTIRPSFNSIKVMIENGDHFAVENPLQYITRGDDVVYQINFEKGYCFDSCSYLDYQLEELSSCSILITFFNIRYSTVISLLAKVLDDIPSKNTSNDSENTPSSSVTHGVINYHAGTGSFISGDDEVLEITTLDAHICENAIDGFLYYKEKAGYLLDCFNTTVNGDGINVYFGCHIPMGVKDLYPVYLEETAEDDFVFSSTKKGYEIIGYNGDDVEVVIPSYHNGLRVVSIAAKAFENKSITKLHLARNIINVEKEAFYNSSLQEITFCDNLENIFSRSFLGSPLTTVHINAIKKPVYSGTYYDAFQDKVDYLESVKDEKKIILFSGSSTRYGYDSTLIEAAFPDYKVVNMGVFAYVNVKPQLEVIKHYLKEGDIFIHSPEFDWWCLENQFGTDTSFEKNLFYFFEGNYHNLQYVDIRQYTDFFDSFRDYQAERNLLPKQSYAIAANHYDDEGNYYEEETYNKQGDFILYRENNPIDERIMQPETPYTVETFYPELFDGLEDIYDDLGNIGVECYFTFAPKNIRSLTIESTDDEIASLNDLFVQKVTVKILGNIQDLLFPGTCFYLIDNHLSTEYARVRTNKVIDWLTKAREEKTTSHLF